MPRVLPHGGPARHPAGRPPARYTRRMDAPFRIAAEVREALAARGPVVALETSVVAHGLPPPHNLDAARRCAAAARGAGAVPAAVAVVGGEIAVGATDAELER